MQQIKRAMLPKPGFVVVGPGRQKLRSKIAAQQINQARQRRGAAAVHADNQKQGFGRRLAHREFVFFHTGVVRGTAAKS